MDPGFGHLHPVGICQQHNPEQWAPNVTFLGGPYSTDFSSSFTAADFAAAQTGPSSFVLSPNPVWISSLPSAAAASWIGTNSTDSDYAGNTALYAVSFDETGPISSASLTLDYAIDNYLGYSNPGIYINGKALPSSTGIGWYTSQYAYTDSSIGSDLVEGTNWLYFDAVNVGGPAGLIFSADISTGGSPATAPEPTTFVLFGSSLIVFGGVTRARKLKNRV